MGVRFEPTVHLNYFSPATIRWGTWETWGSTSSTCGHATLDVLALKDLAFSLFSADAFDAVAHEEGVRFLKRPPRAADGCDGHAGRSMQRCITLAPHWATT